MTADKCMSYAGAILNAIRGVTKRVVAVFCLVAYLINAPASAQEKTPANAFEFIRASMSDGSWEGEYEYCERELDEFGVVVWESCNPHRATIGSVYYVDNSYCALTFQMNAPEGSITRTVDLRKQFQVGDPGYSYLIFYGPVSLSNGEVVARWDASTTNNDVRVRVFAALEFLQAACKPASPW